MSWVPGNHRSGVAAVGGMPEMVRAVRDWGRGVCELRLSSSDHGLPLVSCPLVTGHLKLWVDRYFEDGHLESREFISRQLRLSDAAHLATIQAARGVVLSDAVMEYYGRLPDEGLGFVGERLAQYLHGVAASRAQAEAAPILTEVYADAHIRMLVGEEEEEEEEVVEEEEELMDDDAELQAPSPAGPAETAVVEGQVEYGKSREEEEEEEGEERCSICLEKMEAAGGERERCWLPCAHSFHRACVGRWLQQKGQCPLCRLQVVRQA